MNPLVESLKLTEQQIKYIIYCYADFWSLEEIMDAFCEYFPEAVAAFKAELSDQWKSSLEASIRHLSPEHPKFPAEYRAIFSRDRIHHLSSIEDAKLGSPRFRLLLMDDTVKELNAHAKEHPEKMESCKKLVLDVIKIAQKEPDASQKGTREKIGITNEDGQELRRIMTDEQFEELRTRYKQGEHPEMVIADIILTAARQLASPDSGENGDKAT